MGQRGPRASHSSGGARGSPSPPSPPLLPPPEREKLPQPCRHPRSPCPFPCSHHGTPSPQDSLFWGERGLTRRPLPVPPHQKQDPRAPEPSGSAGGGGQQRHLGPTAVPSAYDFFFFFLPFLLFSRLLFLIFWGYFWDANSGRPNWNQSRGGGSLTIREDFLGFANF